MSTTKLLATIPWQKLFFLGFFFDCIFEFSNCWINKARGSFTECSRKRAYHQVDKRIQLINLSSADKNEVNLPFHEAFHVSFSVRHERFTGP